MDECIWSECHFVVFVVTGRKDANRTPMLLLWRHVPEGKQPIQALQGEA